MLIAGLRAGAACPAARARLLGGEELDDLAAEFVDDLLPQGGLSGAELLDLAAQRGDVGLGRAGLAERTLDAAEAGVGLLQLELERLVPGLDDVEVARLLLAGHLDTNRLLPAAVGITGVLVESVAAGHQPGRAEQE